MSNRLNQDREAELIPKKKYHFQDYLGEDDYIKVMAIADGYVMMRRKGCIPFVMSMKEAKAYIKKKTE